MSVSRKDFQAIADGLKRTRPEPGGDDIEQWRHDVDAVAAALRDVGGLDRNGNRRFDTDRFVAACTAV
jgi:hypothetical protein